jgi:predicted lipid-binding transport protein (Tim44 family)
MKFLTVLLAAALTLGAFDADAARRLGGGGSIGRQSSTVTQRQSSPPPASPTNAAPRDAATQSAAAPGAQPAAQPRRPWGGILGGLAAGLGLAWLAHTLGFGAGFGQFLMFALLALVVVGVVGMLMRRRAMANGQGQGYAYQGGTADAPVSPRQYSPDKVGNDASARPWERAGTAFEANRYGQQQSGGGVRIGSGLEAPQAGLEGSQQWGVPAGFDTEGFLAAAKRNFVTLQDAWDRGDLNALRGMMTDEMLREIGGQLAEREKQPGSPGKTDVVVLDAQLLGIEEHPTEYLASVEFSGMIREDPSAGPSPFREVWNMVKPKDGSAGWLVAGVQALQ